MSLLLLTKKQITSTLSEKILRGCFEGGTEFYELKKDKLLLRHIDTLTEINVKIDQCELPTFYWLPKLHKNPFKLRIISNSSQCSTNILSTQNTSALTAGVWLESQGSPIRFLAEKYIFILNFSPVFLTGRRSPCK